MAELQPLIDPVMYARISAAAHELERAMKRAHLTPRQIQDVSVAIQEYFQEMQNITDGEQVKPVAPTGEPKTGWTEEDLKPFLDAGAIRLK